MSTLDEIAQKRAEARQKQASNDTHQQSLNAIQENGREVSGATDKLAKSTDADSIIQQLKELHLTALLDANKPREPKTDTQTIIVKDQLDIKDSLSELGDKIAESISKLDSSESFGQQAKFLTELKNTISEYSKTISSAEAGSKKQFTELLKAVNAINVSPVVNVPQPKVTVQPSKLDLQPLQDTLEKYMETPEAEEKLDLECYRAQDITESSGMQYVGFINPDGGWYIIENDVKGNKLRYVFGGSGYSEAFSKAPTYEYLLLNEALDAISA